MSLKIRKSLEEKLLGVVEIRKEKIIWIDNTELLLYSENPLPVKTREFGLNTSDYLQVMKRMTENTNINLQEKHLEVVVKKQVDHNYKVNNYTVKYQLALHGIDEERIKKIEKLDSIKNPILTWKITEELKKLIGELFNKELAFKQNEIVYIADEKDTIFIPREQPTIEGKIDYEYDMKTVENGLEGIENIKNISLELYERGMGKILLELENGIKFYYYFTNLVNDN